jgi:glycosyltransferase involved in cell wall biosynthesis
MQDTAKAQRRTYPLAYVGRSASQIERDFGMRLERLAREGFDVRVYAADDGGFSELVKRGVQPRPIPVGTSVNLAGLMGAYFIIQADFIEEQPVLVHVFDDALAWVGAFAARRAGVPATFVTVEEHLLADRRVHLELDSIVGIPPAWVGALEGVLDEIAGGPIRGGFEAAYRWLASHTDKYLVTNEWDFQTLQDLSIVPPNKLEMLIGGNGVELGDFEINDEEFPSEDEARAIFDVPNKWRQVTGYAGPLTLKRGARDLLDCIESVADTHPAAGWLIGLDGESAPMLVRELRRWEDRGHVRTVEMPDERGHFYRALDFLVCPAYRLGVANELMEAAATRVASLAYNTPAASTVIEDTQTGRLVATGDTSGLVAAVRRALDNTKLWGDYGIRARARASQRFSRHHVEDQIMRLYDTVLETRMASDAP